MNRRQFLKRGLLGAGALVILPTWARGAAPSDQIRTGHIGVGGMGSGHVDWFRHERDVKHPSRTVYPNGMHAVIAKGLAAEPDFEVRTATLDEPFPADRKRHRFLFGHVRSESGELRCTLSAQTESHMLTALSGANCMVEAPPSAAPLPPGSPVTCTPLPWTNEF